jgi:hypothetical protein
MSIRYIAGFVSAFYNPLQVPNAPTIGTATTTSTTTLSITFTAPTNIGGSAITGYIATARRVSDGATFSASGASSPILITGLTAVPFTVTVAAVNSFGPSASSAASNSITPANLVVGQSYAGGFYAGQISTAGDGVADFNLVIGPVSSAQSTLRWKISGGSTAGTDSVINGPTNSANMNNSDHPAAQFCEGLTVGGFTDWYMPAMNELEVCYYNLKPTTTANFTSTGANVNAVPSRGSTYTSSIPGQTSATAFQTGNAEAFASAGYWASTQFGAALGRYQNFNTGKQYYATKSLSYRVRAVRRVAV